MPAPSRRHRRSRHKTQNLPPGSPVYAGSERDTPIKVEVMDYSADTLREETITAAGALKPFQGSDSVTWINLDGIHDVAEVQAICRQLAVHPLWLEDILNPLSRTKAESLDGMQFVRLKMLHPSEPGALHAEQVSIVLAPQGIVVTFQERPGDAWQPLRARIRSSQGRIRQLGADYLFHALIDAVVDQYLVAAEALDSRIDQLEDDAMAHTDRSLQPIYALKAELTAMRPLIRPLREVVQKLLRSHEEHDLIRPETRPYFDDLHDHTLQLIDIIESGRERIVGIFELRLALDARRLNDIMRVLTVISSVFIPITFIAGVYGMNFPNMPELTWAWAYPAVWLLMLAVAAGMLTWFRTRRWL
ncbi:MAG: magnesium transporter [Myxococcota bacterium]|jgi:magnesium transporter